MEPFNWDDFASLYDWEFDFLCEEQKKDVSFYLKKASEKKGKILEIGCGSGRITLPLARAGYDVTAVDSAPKFLSLLEERNTDLLPIKTVLSDMRDLKLEDRFDLVFLPYSTFQYLLTQEEQFQVMKNIAGLMKADAELILDVSPYTADGKDLPDFYPFYTHFNDEIKAMVTMFTSYRIDREKKIQYWEDKYILRYTEGNQTEFIHRLALKRMTPDEMEYLLKSIGYKIKAVFGDFECGPVNEDSDNWIFVAEKEK